MNTLLVLSALLISFDPAATDLSVGVGMWSSRPGALLSLELYHIPDDDVHLAARLPVTYVGDGSVRLDGRWYRGPSGMAATLENLAWEGRSGDIEAGLVWGTKRIIMNPGAHGMYLTVDGAVPRPVLELGVSSPWVDASAWVEGIDLHEASGGEVMVGSGAFRVGSRISAAGHDWQHVSVDGLVRYAPTGWLVLGGGYRHSVASGIVAWARMHRRWTDVSSEARLEVAAGREGFVPFVTAPLTLVQPPIPTVWGLAFHGMLTWGHLSMSADLVHDTRFSGSLAAGWGTAGTFYFEGAMAFSESGPVLVSGSMRWLVHDPVFLWASGSGTVSGQGPANTVMVGLGLRTYWFRP